MNVVARGVYLGLVSRQGKDGKTYHSVNVDFDGELQSLSTSDPSKFSGLSKYLPYDFRLFLGQYRGHDGGTQSYIRAESALPVGNK